MRLVGGRYRARRWGLPLAAALLLGLAGGCSDDPETVDATMLGACVRPTDETGAGTPVRIEFRLDGDVVAAGETEVGAAFVAEVPLGRVDVYADGEHLGYGEANTPSGADDDGRPTGGIYISGEGCPDSPF